MAAGKARGVAPTPPSPRLRPLIVHGTISGGSLLDASERSNPSTTAATPEPAPSRGVTSRATRTAATVLAALTTIHSRGQVPLNEHPTELRLPVSPRSTIHEGTEATHDGYILTRGRRTSSYDLRRTGLRPHRGRDRNRDRAATQERGISARIARTPRRRVRPIRAADLPANRHRRCNQSRRIFSVREHRPSSRIVAP